jgi:hypothetical protein
MTTIPEPELLYEDDEETKMAIDRLIKAHNSLREKLNATGAMVEQLGLEWKAYNDKLDTKEFLENMNKILG